MEIAAYSQNTIPLAISFFVSFVLRSIVIVLYKQYIFSGTATS